MSKNDITGDSIRSKPLSKEAEDNWDRIFRKRINEQKLSNEDMLPTYELDKSTGELSRIDIIGQNGNDGEHYDE
jgi:predicted nucleotidyltransferase